MWISMSPPAVLLPAPPEPTAITSFILLLLNTYSISLVVQWSLQIDKNSRNSPMQLADFYPTDQGVLAWTWCLLQHVQSFLWLFFFFSLSDSVSMELKARTTCHSLSSHYSQLSEMGMLIIIIIISCAAWQLRFCKVPKEGITNRQ